MRIVNGQQEPRSVGIRGTSTPLWRTYLHTTKHKQSQSHFSTQATTTEGLQQLSTKRISLYPLLSLLYIRTGYIPPFHPRLSSEPVNVVWMERAVLSDSESEEFEGWDPEQDCNVEIIDSYKDYDGRKRCLFSLFSQVYTHN